MSVRSRAAGPGPAALAALVAVVAVVGFAVPAAGAAADTAPRGSPESTGSGIAEVVICASHHHVLRHWLRAVRAGWLPAHGVTVVHFDAHPDLGVPEGPLPRALAEQPAALERALDIASFQLAAVWLGLVGRVVWLHPGWARQLPDGEHRFHLGTDADGHLHVDLPSDYYVLSPAWAPSGSLRDPVEVSLRVAALESLDPGAPLAPGPAILDIDLDGFATRNPAADLLRAQGVPDAALTELRRIFDPERLSLAADPAQRRAELDAILAAVRGVAAGGPVDALLGAWTLWRAGIPAADLWHLWGLVGSLPANALSALVENGRDLVGLPERRVATHAEIGETARRLVDLVRRGAVHPRLVTVSRSVDDGFTPPALWPEIEWTLLVALRDQLGPATRVRFDRTRPAPRP